jgi:ribosomal-protein-alanine N-acetyltransferase
MQFETERLTIRLMQSDDLSDVLVYWLDAKVNQYLPFPLDREFATQKFNQSLLPWSGQVGEKLVLAIVEKKTATVIGELMFKHLDKQRGLGEIGYCLNVASQGQGYALESVKALLDIAFNHCCVHKLMAIVDSRNQASAKLLDKLGMRQEAHLIEHDKVDGHWCDLYYYGMLAREFH